CKVKDERVTHKCMAWHFLQSLYEIYDTPISNRKILPYTVLTNKEIFKGYGVNAPMNFNNLVTNIGFHMASEKLAAFEFEALDAALKKHHPKLYSDLESKTMNLPGLSEKITGIDWIRIHGTAEEEHFGNAL